MSFGILYLIMGKTYGRKKEKTTLCKQQRIFTSDGGVEGKCREAEEQGKPQPPVTNYIGECFLKIANHLSYRPNFINYTYRDEMISDGIENCLQYVHNFNPDKSNNPFAYFTQIIYYAFLRRIQKEKKQSHVKNKLIENMTVDEN